MCFRASYYKKELNSQITMTMQYLSQYLAHSAVQYKFLRCVSMSHKLRSIRSSLSCIHLFYALIGLLNTSKKCAKILLFRYLMMRKITLHTNSIELTFARYANVCVVFCPKTFRFFLDD